MSTQITLATKPEGETVIAGVKFADGVATVPSLGPNARKYFELIGATVTDSEAQSAAPSTDAAPVDSAPSKAPKAPKPQEG